MDGQIITWILGLIAAFFGIKWQASAKENQNIKQRLSQKKEELYTSFIEFYMELLNSNKKTEEEIVEKMREFNQKLLLTASNKVFLTYGDLIQNFYNNSQNTKQTMRLFGELILVMREDLGHKDWMNSLYWFDSVRPWIKDINKYTPEKYRGLRRHYNKKVNPTETKEE